MHVERLPCERIWRKTFRLNYKNGIISNSFNFHIEFPIYRRNSIWVDNQKPHPIWEYGLKENEMPRFLYVSFCNKMNFVPEYSHWNCTQTHTSNRYGLPEQLYNSIFSFSTHIKMIHRRLIAHFFFAPRFEFNLWIYILFVKIPTNFSIFTSPVADFISWFWMFQLRHLNGIFSNDPLSEWVVEKLSTDTYEDSGNEIHHQLNIQSNWNRNGQYIAH